MKQQKSAFASWPSVSIYTKVFLFLCSIEAWLIDRKLAGNAFPQSLVNKASNSLFLPACFSFSMATKPTCRTLSLDKPNLFLLFVQYRLFISFPLLLTMFLEVEFMSMHKQRSFSL
jgi:hypothetical protein